MEDARHPANQVLKVNRTIEWSRLEEQTMTSVYERLVPIVGARIESNGDARHPEGSWGADAAGRQERALGA